LVLCGLLLSEFCRPKSLLVFINPIAGRGRAVKTYNDKVAPLFELAGVSTEVILTERRHQACEMVRRIRLDDFDGLVFHLQKL
jgi:ceramide kinase